MKLAISNIAWRKEEELAMADLFVQMGIRGVEVAATKIWENPTETTDAEIMAYREFWNSHGIEIVALQSLLFGKIGLTMFGSESSRREMADYLKRMVVLAASLGAKILVFGSPKNRQKGNLSSHDAVGVAREFFLEVGTFAASYGVRLCIEPNARKYACDFIMTAMEGRELIELVDSPGFGLHLDLACMMLENENIPETLKDNISFLHHVHMSAPDLGDVAKISKSNISSFLSTLAQNNYRHWVSIEMREQAALPQGNFEFVKNALKAVLLQSA